jgi:hypothetical protein
MFDAPILELKAERSRMAGIKGVWLDRLETAPELYGNSRPLLHECIIVEVFVLVTGATNKEESSSEVGVPGPRSFRMANGRSLLNSSRHL